MAVSLEKGQRISLDKNNSLRQVFMGLGWDAVKASGFFGKLLGGSKNIDLDASCVLLDGNKNILDVVYFGHLKSRDGSIMHSGDNLTGDGEGDDEVINVNLARIPAEVTYLVFTVSSFQGQSFNQIQNAYCRLVNSANNAEIARYTITGGGEYTGMIMAAVYRKDSEWKMRAIGESIVNCKTVEDALPMIQRIL